MQEISSRHGRGLGRWELRRYMKRYRIYQYVGDRDKPTISTKDIAFTLAANPMSDRMQRVIEIDER